MRPRFAPVVDLASLDGTCQLTMERNRYRPELSTDPSKSRPKRRTPQFEPPRLLIGTPSLEANDLRLCLGPSETTLVPTLHGCPDGSNDGAKTGEAGWKRYTPAYIYRLIAFPYHSGTKTILRVTSAVVPMMFVFCQNQYASFQSPSKSSVRCTERS